jgi:hypothetical protein
VSNSGHIPIVHKHSQSAVTINLAQLRVQFTRQDLDPLPFPVIIVFPNILSEGGGTYRVDLPAPLAPTMAILESRLTSMLTFLRMILSEVYPKDTSSIWRRGGDIFSVSGNLTKVMNLK